MKSAATLLFALAPCAMGTWVLPSSVKSAADARPRSRYDDGGPYNNGAGCTGSFEPGTAALQAFLLARFPESTTHIGGYSCRRNTASLSKVSIHGTGRALDIMVSESRRGVADNAKGDPIANWLVMHAHEIGIQVRAWEGVLIDFFFFLPPCLSN
jgi:hypothetical protein